MIKLVDQYNNTYRHCINKKPIVADYSALTEIIEINPNTSKFKVNDSLVDNEVVKKTKFNTLKTKKYNLEKKIPDATTLIHINQYNR